MPTTSIAYSPYPDGTLPVEHQAEIAKIRACLTTWISATNDVRREVPGAREKMVTITDALLGLQVAEPYAFTPSPPYPFQRILLSCIRCYWLALVASFDDFEKNEMKERLNCLPPDGNRISTFNGEKCVEMPGDLNAQEYEGLMRIMHFVALGMVSKDVVKTWYEIGEIGVQTWEEVEE
ncbi:hypothetical protein BDZ94DRAFT_884739 [Collybia nuda]|uniref:Uncharacterized protein n=1 Tax=Collybia nuda TaxID=64659 RepID=A0A9P5XZR9_9AGAR|nr:hypothetical protein BDZ94DRAFT_884739 [Collybia nuda]